MAANSSIDWAVARKKGALIYPGELLGIPPVFEEANAQNRPVPRAQVVDAKSFYGEKGRGGANSGGNALFSGASTTGSVWDMYNNFGFKYHNSYPTTQGYMKPYSDFAGRNWSKQALKFKGLSVYFNPKGYQYFIPKVYHSNLIKKVNSTLFQGYPWNRVLLRRRFSRFSSFFAHHLFGFFQTVGVSLHVH